MPNRVDVFSFHAVRGPAELSDAFRQDVRILTAAIPRFPQPTCQGLSETGNPMSWGADFTLGASGVFSSGPQDHTSCVSRRHQLKLMTVVKQSLLAVWQYGSGQWHGV